MLLQRLTRVIANALDTPDGPPLQARYIAHKLHIAPHILHSAWLMMLPLTLGFCVRTKSRCCCARLKQFLDYCLCRGLSHNQP
jgi:hypothetical protein